ncbi:myotubularin-related protein 4 isoform X3 [Plutella xylostella]|uniref:myotubularin-related protein 4 isoform X3 n=1 Tax=Plutella xylostella TaxID=51655 RepID=UPI002032F417|nr:myotubularin-related protein 4 isoform X3 [Plutella xylostella]
MLINTFLDTEDFVHLYYPEDEPAAAQGCGAGARMHSKYPPRPPSPLYDKITSSSSDMCERERARAPPPPEPPPHRVRAADLYPRLRTHYDEPGLDVPFTPICGEFVQWVGRTADGGALAMSNYRVHSQPRRRGGGASLPLRLLDSVEVRDLLHLVLLCKDGRTVKCTFSTGEQCLEWWRRLTTTLAPVSSLQETFAAGYAAWAKEQPPASVHRALVRHSQQRHWFAPELERLGFTAKGSWRVTAVNSDFKLCPSYPPLLIVPACIGDEDMDSVARFRAMRRVPAVVWRHRGNGAVIARSSQPEVGWLGWRSSEDERLLAAFVTACTSDRPHHSSKQTNKLLIVDARSYASAVTNRARGGGCECQQYYPAADIQFMCLPNIHHVRRSFQQLRALVAEPADQANWHSNLERTLWLQYISGLGRAAGLVARAVLNGRPVLVHCSDGWDRTPQIVAAAQLHLDPYYRTCEGFRVLIEREWLDFGHKFADRCGHQFGPEEPNERSPIFLQWLDLVHQCMLQYPTSFQFSEAYLIKLLTHVHSCMFGTFLCNSPRERAEARVSETTAHVWRLLEGAAYRNHLYCPPSGEQVLWPDYSVRSLRVWASVFAGAHHEAEPEPPAPPAPPAGPMTKTRSCDNLLNEGEKRTAQRRCSDPNIAADVMKLSSILPHSPAIPRRVESQLESLRISPPERDQSPDQPEDRSGDQVDGLHPNHFENGSSSSPSSMTARDLASTSSSLERELVAAAPPPPLFDDAYTDVMEAAREAGRSRHISITWRSVSESSHNTDSSDIDTHRMNNNHNSIDGDLANHNVVDMTATLTNHNRIERTAVNGDLTNGDRLDAAAAKLLTAELGGVTSSSISSESEGEGCSVRPRRARPPSRARGGSQQTLCGGSPRAGPPRRCPPSNTSGIETSGDSLAGSEHCYCAAARATCVCGGSGRDHAARDPLDGLPPASEPLQARLHQIILHQRMVVQELSAQLASARAMLSQRVSSPPAPPPPPPQPQTPQMTSSGSASTSGSGSEVEVGVEARGVAWLPDSAAPRCQHCRSHFWLARRRHHCRKCGGIFCGSCSEMSSIGEWAAVRVCRRCRALR